MKSKQTRSHKGYHNIPIYHAPKRRTGNTTSSSSSSPCSDKDTENKYNKKWFADKIGQILAVIIILILFFIVTIVIYNNMPSGESALPPQNTTKHELHSKINDIVSPQFNVDESITNTIPQINPMHNTDNIKYSGKNAIVYILQETGKEDVFCALLLSISSTISSTTSLKDNIEIIVFMHYTFSIDKFDLDELAISMNFKIIKYEQSGDIPVIFEHIIKTLQPEKYDSIIYLNHNSFVLQDLSVLFQPISIENYHFGGIWSFHNKAYLPYNQYQQCLLPSMFIMNINDITEHNVNYIEMFKEQPLCDNTVNNDDTNTIDIDTAILKKVKKMSEKYGIISLPWWYSMDHAQFQTYYGEINNDKENNNNVQDTNNNLLKGVGATLANPQIILSWLKYINLFEFETHSEPIPLIIDLTQLNINDKNDDTFWTEWLSIRQPSIDFCHNIFKREGE